MAQEIKLHRDLNHPHIAKFISSFESKYRYFWYVIFFYYVMTRSNIFIFSKGSRVRRAWNLQKEIDDGISQKTWLIDRTRSQILYEIEFLHKKDIIHRDLKVSSIT